MVRVEELGFSLVSLMWILKSGLVVATVRIADNGK
jgi:hypothetical protein